MPKIALAAVRISRPRRITRLAAALADRAKRHGKVMVRPFCRKHRGSRAKRMIAYDLETTRIEVGTPDPLYITAYGEGFSVSEPLRSITDLRRVLVSRFLTPENHGVRFCAWNGNKFDCFFIGAALLHAGAYELRPYLTHNKSLRGVRVTHKSQKVEGSDKPLSWEFLDGFSMTIGSPPTKLKKFLKTFAPDFQKLEGPDFENEDFDSSNHLHVAYAERDSEGLFHGMQMAESIVRKHFEQGLQPTIGNLGIRILQAHLPHDVKVWAPGYALETIIRKHLLRGGFCFASRQFEGPVWKYDINQAYAAAMRDTRLPAGRVTEAQKLNKYADVFICRVSAVNQSNRIPFYVRDEEGKALFALTQIDNAWITSDEYNQLASEKWSIEIHQVYFWEQGFNMRELVDKLEGLRMAAPEGPNGAEGTMLKALGNNGYGKTVEELDGLELIMSAERPGEDFFTYQDESDQLQHIWARINKPQAREYHQPQLGAFITASVRMVVRRAILLAPDAWLYSDTDCCMFSRPVGLSIDPKKYGKWKIETDGESYRVITKKVYASFATDPEDPTKPKEGKAKGLNVKRLSMSEFADWYSGKPPKQRQVQRQNFLAVMTGSEMFLERVKVGQRVKTNERQTSAA